MFNVWISPADHASGWFLFIVCPIAGDAFFSLWYGYIHRGWYETNIKFIIKWARTSRQGKTWNTVILRGLMKAIFRGITAHNTFTRTILGGTIFMWCHLVNQIKRVWPRCRCNVGDTVVTLHNVNVFYRQIRGTNEPSTWYDPFEWGRSAALVSRVLNLRVRLCFPIETAVYTAKPFCAYIFSQCVQCTSQIWLVWMVWCGLSFIQ